MAKKLFVGSLSWGTDARALRSAFERFGEVEDAVVITDAQTGRSRGFGFVTFVQGDSAERAVNELNGAELDGRRIAVNEAQERQTRPRPVGAPNSAGGGFSGPRRDAGGGGGPRRDGGGGGGARGGRGGGGGRGGSGGGRGGGGRGGGGGGSSGGGGASGGGRAGGRQFDDQF